MAGRSRTSVIDRIVALGFEPEKNLDWAAGEQARKEYELATGELPKKGLRRKTNGRGSHCFALYPDWFIPRIDKIIKTYTEEIRAERAAQGRLFDKS